MRLPGRFLGRSARYRHPLPANVSLARDQITFESRLVKAAPGMRHQDGKVLIHQLPGGVSKDLFRRPVGEQDGALLVEHEDGGRGVLGDEAVAFLALSKRLLGPTQTK